MADLIQVSTTVKTRTKADKIAKALLVKRLAACVQVLGPIQSAYHWKGKIEQSTEWLCLVKAREKHYTSIEALIKKMHTYKVPEILAFPILKGNREYLDWMRRETTRPLHS